MRAKTMYRPNPTVQWREKHYQANENDLFSYKGQPAKLNISYVSLTLALLKYSTSSYLHILNSYYDFVL